MEKTKTMTLIQFRRAFFICTLLVATMLLSSSCDDDDPQAVNEEELITTVNLNFQKLDVTGNPSNDTETFTWRDLDGDGPDDPVIDPVILEANASYRLTIELLDESNASAIEDITEEVKAEGDEHQFFFEASTALQIITNYEDEDDNGFPIGMVNTLTTDGLSEGTFTVTLRHEPDKEGSGVAEGNIANAGGETDVQARFEVNLR